MQLQRQVEDQIPAAAKAVPPAKGARAHPAGIILLCLYIAAALVAGILLRDWTWRAAAPIHFADDIQNGLFWGRHTVLEGRRLAPTADNGDVGKGAGDSWPAFFNGWVSIYDYSSNIQGHVYDLDYAPLRLMVMSLWAKEAGMPPPPRPNGTGRRGAKGGAAKSAPAADVDPLAVAGPLLFLNLLCELASAIAVFLLVRTWLVRCSATARAGWFRRRFPRGYVLVCSLAAATVAWLEPSMILDAHAWPQWDVWIMPLYLFAALAMMNDRWVICGSLIAIGAMLKPQILIVAPFFLLVPLFGAQWRRAAHFLAGFGLAGGIIAFPWLVRGLIGWGCIVEAGLTCAGIWIVRRKVQLEGGAWMGIRNVKQSETPFWCCLAFAAAIWIAGWLCGGDFTWFRTGFLQSGKAFQELAEKNVWCNLPALLVSHGWTLADIFAHIDIGGWQAALTMRLALRLAYLLALIVCSIGAGRHLRKRDPRFLISIAVPWLLMFALMGQMHSRYLMWGAVASAVALGVSARLSILHFVISAASGAMILYRLANGRDFEPLRPALELIERAKPNAPYFILACIAVYFWFSFWRSRPVRIPGSA